MAMLQPSRRGGARWALGLIAAAALLLGTQAALSFTSGYTPQGSARECSSIALGAKKRLTWTVKQRQNAEYKARHPPPAMTNKERKRRLLKIDLFRREDLMLTEKYLYNDPRDARWQWDIDKTRQYMDEQATLVDDIKRKKLTSREDLNLPLPPTDLKLTALAKISRSSAAQASKEQAKKKESEEKKPKVVKGQKFEDPDLTDVDIDFMNYKGLVMSRRQKAQYALRAQRRKKQERRR
ncbi:unnamed protein product [Effrenium voratum]|nr:unnamed protein product [Effrenium voratum]CAJ1378807.1 unnamed protein product [Effrenium voratum]CAJ1460998.1 unnamed protein product [Effrenium voratum]